MQKTKYAVFFDVDGTLYDCGQPVVESTRQAIASLRANGHLAFVCSGRGRLMVPDEPILELGFDGVMAGCGMYAEYKEKCLFEELMSEELIRWTLSVMDEYPCQYIMEGSEYIYYNPKRLAKYGPDWYIHEILRQHANRFVEVGELDKIKASKWGLQCHGSEQINEELIERLRERYQMLCHLSGVAEAVPTGYSKGKGIERLCKQLGISMENTISFGDSCNDIDMLRATKLGIVMGNGTDVAKKEADYITEPMREDGIWKALCKFGLIAG